MTACNGRILVVDDSEINRKILTLQLELQGYTIAQAENGQQALDMLGSEEFDLVLLDIMMPVMDGYQVLERIKADLALRHIPVIVITAVGALDSTVRCIEMGADDYLLKPFKPPLLKARVEASLEKKHLRDMEQAYLQRLQLEQEKSERLLLNILPGPIAEQLKQKEHATIADSFDEVTTLFADIVDFTKLATQVSAPELVILLNEIFSSFDALAEQHGLEKIKTIGDAYMAVGGLPTPRLDHAQAVAEMALDMLATIGQFRRPDGEVFRLRIGINSGPVVAGVIGVKKFIYDLWGDTVNIASRMESHGLASYIQVAPAAYTRLQDHYLFDRRGAIEIKGLGKMETYFLTGRLTNG